MGKPRRKKPAKPAPDQHAQTANLPDPERSRGPVAVPNLGMDSTREAAPDRAAGEESAEIPAELRQTSHRLRRILFLLAALVVLALLILLLIRGPARATSNHSPPVTLAGIRAMHSITEGLAFVPQRDCTLARSGLGLTLTKSRCCVCPSSSDNIRQNLID